MGPIAQSDGHDLPRLLGELVPREATVIENILIGFEDAVVCLAKVFRLGGIVPHPVTLVLTGSASDGSGGDEWSEASEEKSSSGGQ
jgi:hypothetical protein